MNSSPKSNKSHSESLKRCRTESSSIGFIDDNTVNEEIILDTEDDNHEIVPIFDDEFIKNLDSLLVKSEADLKRSKDLLANVKQHEDLCAKTVKELKNTKKSYIKVCTYAFYMNVVNIVPATHAVGNKVIETSDATTTSASTSASEKN